MPIGLAGSGAECLTSISRRGSGTLDRGGRPTPTTCVSASTSADPAPVIPLPFHTSRLLTWPRRLSVCASTAALSSTPERGGPFAETLRAALSLWPPPRRRPPARARKDARVRFPNGEPPQASYGADPPRSRRF